MHQQTLFDQQSALEAACEEFLADNPRVWILFTRYAFQLIHAGHRHYSARAIVHRIRWHTDISTRSDDRFKINNNHSAYLARKFIQEYPKHKGFFHVREVKE